MFGDITWKKRNRQSVGHAKGFLYDCFMILFHSMKYRLIGFAIALAIGGVVLRVCVALPFAQTLLRDSVAAQQLTIASYVASDIDQSIRTYRTLIGELGAALPLELILQPDKLSVWIKERQRLTPFSSGGLLVFQPDGQGLFAQYPQAAEFDRQDYAESAWFKAVLLSDTAVIGNPQRMRANGEPMLVVAMSIRDLRGRVVAVLAGFTSLNMHGFLVRLQEAQRATQSGFLIISPQEKRIVGASDPSLILTSTLAAGGNSLYDRVMAGYRGNGTAFNKEGDEVLFSIVTVPSTGWQVVTSMPTSMAFYPITAMRAFVVKTTLIALAVLVALLTWLLPYILRPLTEAALTVREMADGKRPLAEIPVKLKDEVGDVLAGFNYLLTRLGEKEAALETSEVRLGFLAHHDLVTGLYNRSILDDRLQRASGQTECVGLHFALLFCDLDDFKSVNDRFGHQAGDVVLQQVAERLMIGRRKTDTVVRFGGDEFVILLTDLYDARNAAVSVARQLLKEIGRPFTLDSQEFSIGVSIGIALYCGANASISQLISQADFAMYQAKRAGKNRYQVFENDLEATS